MSTLYRIGTKGLTASDNNHLVYDADVRRLYIDKDTPVDVVSADTIKESLGISSDGSATKYLNEQGGFVEVDGGGDSLSPTVIAFIASDLTDGMLSISYDRFVADSTTPVEVTLLDNNGVVRNADNTIAMYWNETGLHIDFSACSVEGTWKLCYGVVTGKSADYIMTNNVSSTSTDTEVPTAKAVYDALSPVIADVATAQTTANSKLTTPASAGTVGQVLTLDSDAVTPIWVDPSGGGLTKWGTWENRSLSTTYTAATNGWIKVFFSMIDLSDNVHIQIDSDTVFAMGVKPAGYLSDDFCYTFPVFAGQTYSISHSNGACLAYFAPCV